MCSLGRAVIAENILLVEVCISNIDIAGNNRLEHFICVGLSQDLQARTGVDCRVAHGKKKTEQFKGRVEKFAHLSNGLTNLRSPGNNLGAKSLDRVMTNTVTLYLFFEN